MTKHPDIFGRLAEPFHGSDVKVRKQAGRDLHYITARTAMNRLDDVLGPENWWDEYVPQENSVLCRLTIRLPDGQTLTKADAGGYAGMADQGDDDKSGYSDAFKRACVKFGVARYLYRDGVPDYSQAGEPPSPSAMPPPSGSRNGKTTQEPRQKAPAASPPFESTPAQERPRTPPNAPKKGRDERTCWEAIDAGLAYYQEKLVAEYHTPEAARALTLTTYQTQRHLLGSRLGKATTGMGNSQVSKTLEDMWVDPKHRPALLDELKGYLLAAYLDARRNYAGETLDAIGEAAAVSTDDSDPDCDYPEEPGANG